MKYGMRRTFGNRCLTIKTKKEMKKNLFMVAAVALMASVSCNKEEVTNGATEQPQPQEPSVVVEFTASLGDEATKTTLNEGKTLWLESDKISINGQVFKVKELVDGGASATFVNESELPAGFAAPYTALYPANVTEVPSTQTAYVSYWIPADRRFPLWNGIRRYFPRRTPFCRDGVYPSCHKNRPHFFGGTAGRYETIAE